MTTDNIRVLEQISETKLVNRLLSEHFDGIVLIDAASGFLIRTNDILTGKLLKFAGFDNSTYDEQIIPIIDDRITEIDSKMLKNSMKLSKIKEKLSTQKTYNVDFHTKADKENNCSYKRISYEYLDESNKAVIIMVCKDITGIIANETDPLTGLYNTAGFHKRVKEWIEKNPGRKYRMQRYDIYRFKDINGVYGYDMGNNLLRDFGYYMKQYDTEDSFSAHLNSDHFVRFCSEDSLTVEEYYDALSAYFSGYNLRIPLSVHTGVYDLCEPDCDSFTMSYKALLALQSTKGNFTKHIAYYEKGMMGDEIEHQELLNDIDKAIENEEFEVWFQPQIDYKEKAMIGAEALARWRHPVKGLLLPDVFIPLLEHSDYISIVDKYIIDKACQYMRKWMDKISGKPIILSVNLSRNDIYHHNFCEDLEALVKKYEIPLPSLRLEITESAYIDNPELLPAIVKQLKKAGFIIEMDDFGTGYSSLNTLKDIDIDVLKLDMKFLLGMQNNKKGETIISSVINMASALGLPVIAEGVETDEQAKKLLNFGCQYMQGYYFGKPMPADEYENLLMQSLSDKF